MVDFIFNFHSGWRYLVIASTVLVALFFLYALATRQTSERQETLAMKIWSGVLDIQVTLGIILLLLYVFEVDNTAYYDKLTGHWVLGLVAAVVGHGAAIYERINGKLNPQTRRILGLVLPIAVFVIIFLGISAIDRGLFEMTN